MQTALIGYNTTFPMALAEQLQVKAYNAGSGRLLSPNLIVIDAAREPIKVLRILMEGLAPNERNGIWLVNFHGVPIARALAVFDLIHLDEEHRVLQAIEIAQNRDVEPFLGNPASALILPPKTIARSRSFTGDAIILEPSSASSTDSTVDTPSQNGTEVSLKSRAIPSETGHNAGSNREPRRRRAPRANVPRLTGYCVAGGPSTPYEVRDISVLGFYMITDQRWTPGTVIRITLRALRSDGGFHDSITVFSRVVRWGPDGGGFEFVFSKLEE
jgi:hypothetical protein